MTLCTVLGTYSHCIQCDCLISSCSAFSPWLGNITFKEKLLIIWLVSPKQKLRSEIELIMTDPLIYYLFTFDYVDCCRLGIAARLRASEQYFRAIFYSGSICDCKPSYTCPASWCQVIVSAWNSVTLVPRCLTHTHTHKALDNFTLIICILVRIGWWWYIFIFFIYLFILMPGKIDPEGLIKEK